MLHPSYKELMDKVNSEAPEGEPPIVNSRYSIVIAAAKRARQLIAGAESDVENYQSKKPVSVAVEELMNGSVKIISGGSDDDTEEKMSSSVYDYSFADEEGDNDEVSEEKEYESESLDYDEDEDLLDSDDGDDSDDDLSGDIDVDDFD